ncbi:MASE1 domain-containing protein [Sphingomonas sanguinis]|uniref:MASE1 domain-containing protein n=1 Tax=Sphingomonas sanguinis TaxID=33051 RepID=A0ABU5LRU7_9SPHN|nr:MASE1 domain-containing protein [Sphingomonas sanguinis]MDZ7282446.1 MASE1 domain-containing protein [Sphingomonas sanguinis]
MVPVAVVRFDPRVLLPRRQDWLVLALYAVGFAAMHRLAAYWGGSGFYSLWFPAAGLRLALLWRRGARLTPAIALVEIAVDVTLTPAVLAGMPWTVAIWGIARPVLAYGATIAAIGWLAERRGAALLTAPMPLGLAVVLAPLAAALSAVPQALTSPELTGVSNPREVVVSLAAFAVGDLLGTLFIAPPLLWIADAVSGRAHWRWPLPSLLAGLETAGVLVLGLGLAELLDRAGLGMQPAPVLVAVAWIGLRFGRAAAWGALLVVVLRVLPDTAGAMDTPERLQRHLALATIVVTGYLAGSFADAQATARAMLERRDRLLFQAERLKTLRAMSVAVIHEVSQPLSTLAIEARHLHQLTAGRGDEIADGAALIDRKAEHLATLIRRLRRFGGHAEGAPQPLALTALIDMVATLAEPEAREAGVAMTIVPVDPGWQVMAQEVELAQAVMNLVRNAVQAVQGDAAPGRILLDVTADETQVVIHVANRVPARPVARDGMGIGTHVARAIVEAHGGTLTRIRGEDGMVHAALSLPLIESR